MSGENQGNASADDISTSAVTPANMEAWSSSTDGDTYKKISDAKTSSTIKIAEANDRIEAKKHHREMRNKFFWSGIILCVAVLILWLWKKDFAGLWAVIGTAISFCFHFAATGKAKE